MTAYQDRIPIASTGSSANRAAPAPKPKSNELTGQAIKNAIVFNNTHWDDPHRSEVLAKKREGAAVTLVIKRYDESLDPSARRRS